MENQRKEIITSQMLTDGLRRKPDYGNPRCEKCSFYSLTFHPFVKPDVQSHHDIVCIIPAPSADDTHVLGGGVEWEMIEHILVQRLRIDASRIGYATVVRCRPGAKHITKRAIDMCTPFLYRSLNTERAVTTSMQLILFGAEVLHALINPGISLENAVGITYETPFGRALVTYNIREYFRTVRETLNVGIIDMITRHIRIFLTGSQKAFPEVHVI